MDQEECQVEGRGRVERTALLSTERWGPGPATQPPQGLGREENGEQRKARLSDGGDRIFPAGLT